MKLQKLNNPRLSPIPVMPVIMAVVLVLVPFFPDVQITRPKLLVLELSIFGLVLFWLVKAILSENVVIHKTNINLAIAVYAVYIFLAYFFADNKPVALSELKRMLLCTGMYFLAANIITSVRDRVIVLSGWAVGSTLALIYGILQRFGGVWVFAVPKMGRVISTFGNPIFFAVHLVTFLPVVVGLFFYSKKYFVRFILISVLICGLFGLYFSQTRAAWIGFVVSMLCFGVVSLKSRKTKIIFVSLIVGCSLVFAVFTRHMWLRQQAHLLIWRDTLNMWLHHPLFGTGPGNFHINFPKYASQELLSIWPQKQCIINDAHNEYIQILSETGVIGLGIFIWIVFGFFKYALDMHSKYRGRRQSVLIAGMISGAVALLIQNFFSVDMRFIISAVYLFLIIGFVCSFGDKLLEIHFRIGRRVKTVFLAILLFSSGVVGFSRGPKIHLAGLIHFDIARGGLKLKPSGEGSGLLPHILKPYLAQKKLDETPSFFDEKILEPARTLSELEQLVKEYPGEAKVYEKLGWIYAKEKNFRKAIENFERAVRLNPELFGAYNNLGNIYFHLGNRAKSIEYYKKSLQINNNQVDSHLNLGITYYYEGRLKEAADEFNDVLKIDPENDRAIVMLKRMRE
jgi:O-antigen ligase